MKFSAPHLVAAVALAVSGLAHAQDLSALAPPYSALYVFGDSLSDGGNNRLALGFNGPDPSSASFIPSLPYSPSNTYSNGATWVTPFAAGLGLSAYSAPSLAGGGNYAFGGATTVPTVPAAVFPPSLQSQVGSYLGGSPSGTATALYVIAGGGNDARAVASITGGPTPTQLVDAASLYAATTLQLVNQLKGAGAQNIIVWNVPDLGKTPAAASAGGAAAAGATFIANTFNTFLSGVLAGSGVTIFDTFGTIQSVVADPAAFGFGDVTQACGFAGNGCSASNALFWDGIHPTAYAQNFMAGQMLAVAVPEPASMLLLGMGVLALLAWRRQAPKQG
jgi:outer membrane lipase/esterase